MSPAHTAITAARTIWGEASDAIRHLDRLSPTFTADVQAIARRFGDGRALAEEAIVTLAPEDQAVARLRVDAAMKATVGKLVAILDMREVFAGKLDLADAQAPVDLEDLTAALNGKPASPAAHRVAAHVLTVTAAMEPRP